METVVCSGNSFMCVVWRGLGQVEKTSKLEAKYIEQMSSKSIVKTAKKSGG